MNFLKKVKEIFCNPFIWIYFFCVTFIFLISSNIINISNNILLYILLSIAGAIVILGIYNSPFCVSTRNNKIKRKKSSKEKVL